MIDFWSCVRIREKGMLCAVSIHCSYTCTIYLCTYSVIILPSWKMVVLHVKYIGRYTYVYKHVGRLYQPCRNHCLFTTLWPPCYNQKPASGRDNFRIWTTFRQGCHNLVTTLSQPCDNLVPTFFQPCHYLVVRLLRGCYKLATIHGVKMAVLSCDKVVTT